MTFLNKKAMSPLIATVLLIAFAVSIGALIMNWTTSPIDSPREVGHTFCQNARIKIVSSCRDNSNIFVEIRNEGTTEIKNIILRDKNLSSGGDYYIPESNLEPGQRKRFSVEKIKFDSSRFKAMPVVSIYPDRLVCSSRATETITLNSC